MNWGTKIVIGMATFMFFIISLVAYMFYVHGRDALVDDDYYEMGNRYDQEFRAAQNTLSAKAEPVIQLTEQIVIIKLKDSCAYHLVLKKASNHNDDKNYEGATVGKENLIILKRSELPKGLWFLVLNWKIKEKDFIFKQNLTL